MQLSLSTWPDVEAYLGKSDALIVPVGSTEQHGPTGLLGTDAICPQAVARSAGERLEAMVAPTLSIGMAQHHLGFPGSIALRPSTLMAVVADVVVSLAGHGFRRFYFLNGHGGNVATLRAAFAEIHAQSSLGNARREALHFRLCNWYETPAVRRVAEARFGAAEGSHATPSEISLTWHLHPDAAREGIPEPRVAPTGPIRDASDFRRRHPDGRMGSDPSLASADIGRELMDAAVEDVVADYRRFVRAG